MEKKQITGLIAAAVVFVFVSVSSALTNAYTQSDGFLSGVLSSLTDTYYQVSEPYIGVLDISGVITESSGSIFDTSTYNHSATLKKIDEMKGDKNNKGILICLDTPGGGVDETDEVYLKLMDYREQTQRPVYAYMDGSAMSGGYYIPMAANAGIYANRNTWTGAIGVIISLTNLSGLYERFDIEEINITSGEFKSMGSSGEPLSDESRAILQSLVDESFDQFVDVIITGRNMSEADVRAAADGRIYTAKQALDLGLIDGIMTYDEYKQKIQNENGGITIYEPDNAATFLDSFFWNIKEIMPKSDAQVLQETLIKKGNGVPMYYADLYR